MHNFKGRQVRQCILVVESDQAAARRVSDLIAGLTPDCEVHCACSGFEALQKVENAVVNIVLAAEKLADMTGSTLINILRNVRRSQKKNPTCVLMVSSNGDHGHVKRVEKHAGLFEVVKRPVDPEELRCSLDRAMDWDGLNKRIRFNTIVGRVLMGLVPVAVAIGMLVKWAV